MLIFATALWGLSFPTTKALAMITESVLPATSSWFFASLLIVYRFAVASLIMVFLCRGSLGALTRLEFIQGISLGLFGGAGILFQVDGLAYTHASTSAFLTQCYCVFIPLWVAGRDRRIPTVTVSLSCLFVTVGVAILSGVDWQNLRLGRGEWETIIASLLFTGQILLLDDPRFAQNNSNHFSLIMFVTMALICLPVLIVTTHHPFDLIRPYTTVSALGLLAILVFPCTFGGYMLMNHWQRHINATHAALIYCLEPVFASLMALFLPGWFARWAGITYSDEILTPNLLLGGGLITLANVLIHLPGRSTPPRPKVLEQLRTPLG
jgi:drug/metabolite transporter (DMT)-like permease